jgi:hypothetical protein
MKSFAATGPRLHDADARTAVLSPAEATDWALTKADQQPTPNSLIAPALIIMRNAPRSVFSVGALLTQMKPQIGSLPVAAQLNAVRQLARALTQIADAPNNGLAGFGMRIEADPTYNWPGVFQAFCFVPKTAAGNSPG